MNNDENREQPASQAPEIHAPGYAYKPTESNPEPEKPAEPTLPEPKPASVKPDKTSEKPAWAKEYQPKPAPKEKKNAGVGAAIAFGIFGLILGAGGLCLGLMAYLHTMNAQGQPVATNEDGYYTGNSVEFESTSIAGVVSKVTPAIVSIISESSSSSGGYFFSGGTVQSAGTGMIVTSDGYVLTNKHVIDGARKIQIITDAGDTYDDVDIVGTDPLNDVAYLKINDVSDLPTVTLGDSKTIAVGQPVLAIGNALGAYQNTVTQGIVSGTGRSLEAGDSNGENVETLSDMIQTDAAINPGNSGGPLVNANGDVIGINTAVADANGMGFAIPIAAVKGMLKSITENGKAQRAVMGVIYVPITAEVAKTYNLPVSQGAYVHSGNSRSSAVTSGGPADKAGIQDGDIITKVGNVEVGRAGSVSTLVGEYKVGDTVEITYIRDNKTYTAKVTLSAYRD